MYGLDTDTVDEVTSGFIKTMQRVVYEAEETSENSDSQNNELDFDQENQIRRRRTNLSQYMVEQRQCRLCL